MARHTTRDRFLRLMTLVPLLKKGEELSIRATAGQLGCSEEDLTDDLLLLQMCGIPPYSPDVMIDIDIDGDTATAWSDPPAISHPLRLTRAEALALVSAMEVAGVGKDEPAREKLTAAAMPPQEQEVQAFVRSTVPRAGMAQTAVTAAMDGAKRLELMYASAAAPAPERRIVHPYAVFSSEGNWYLQAFCEKADDIRVFRMDRIVSAKPAGGDFEKPEAVPDAGPLVMLPKLPNAVIEFTEDVLAEVEDLGGAVISRTDKGALRAEFPLAGTRWVARKIVSWLGAARALEPPHLVEAVARSARESAADNESSK